MLALAGCDEPPKVKANNCYRLITGTDYNDMTLFYKCCQLVIILLYTEFVE